jgi:hypothetical protein
MLELDLLQMPTFDSYVNYATSSEEAKKRIRVRIEATRELLEVTEAFQTGGWREVRARVRPEEGDGLEEVLIWLSLVGKLESAHLSETFPFHLTTAPDPTAPDPMALDLLVPTALVPTALDLLVPTAHGPVTELHPTELHPKFLSLVPMPKPSCRGRFPMKSSAGAQGTNVATAIKTRPSMRALEAALQALQAEPASSRTALEAFLRCKTRWSILLSFYETCFRAASRSTSTASTTPRSTTTNTTNGSGLVYIAGAAVGAHACLSGCGYSAPNDLMHLGAYGAHVETLPRNALANGHALAGRAGEGDADAARGGAASRG